MYRSAFSYTLSRPYPYPWFSWAVVVGCIAATAIFSVLNLASSGYEIRTQYIRNPNETEHPATPAWYQKKPWSFATKVSTSCQDQNFQLGSRFFTNNTRLQYEIIDISNITRGGYVPATSFTYHYNLITDCTLVGLSIKRRNVPQDVQTSFKVSAITQCMIERPAAPIVLTLRFSLDSDNDYVGYLQNESLNNRTQSALWWASALLTDPLLHGTLFNSVGMEVAIPSLLYAESSIVTNPYQPPGQQVRLWSHILLNETDAGQANSSTFDRTSWSSILTQWGLTFGNDTLDHYTAQTGPDMQCHLIYMDMMAKAFYSFLMTDLGQAWESNIMANPANLIRYLNAMRGTCWGSIPANGTDSPLFRLSGLPYYPFNDTNYQDPLKFYQWYNTGIPQVTPAVIETQYLCQIPQIKRPGSLIVTIVIANLVLLQALWVIYNWIVRMILEAQDPTANECLRCLGLTWVDDGPTPSPYNPHFYAGYDPMAYQPPPIPLVDTTPVIRRRPVPELSSHFGKERSESSTRLLMSP